MGQTVPDPQTGQRPPAQLNRTNGVDGQGNLNRATVTFDTSVQAPDQNGNLVQALNETSSSVAFLKSALHAIAWGSVKVNKIRRIQAAARVLHRDKSPVLQL